MDAFLSFQVKMGIMQRINLAELITYGENLGLIYTDGLRASDYYKLCARFLERRLMLDKNDCKKYVKKKKTPCGVLKEHPRCDH